MTFNDLELREELRRSIRELGHTQPTPIQEQAIPKAVEGHDLMCCAQTGTGKTAAFALPILQRLASQPRAKVRAVIMVPTRELAIQVGKSVMEYGKHLEIVTATIFGGVPFEPQEMILRHGADILVATPGRMKDHIWRGNIDFRYTQFLVLDEADRMLDMGFIKAVREIVELMPSDRQSMLFSATLDSEIRRFSKGILRNPQRIDVTPPRRTLDEVDQFLVRTRPGQKQAKLESLIRKYQMERTLVFARTKSGASRLASRLRERGYNASAIHSDRTQVERMRALEGFRRGEVKILVATDIAARGIDVDDISHVVNYDLPYSTKDYVHRIGRTARAGRRGVAISLVTPGDARGIAAIERSIDQKLTWEDDSKNNNVRPH
ncbi:MAG: DEAD/DEAH box helicase [Candidatus Eisenbacteria sp.]|nr:DEAD/DEAH box helicase [Candidatus Eisenbacteria bacterium]